MKSEPKALVWMASSRKVLTRFPEAIKASFGFGLYQAQVGLTPPNSKPLKGFGGSGVLELFEDHRGDTYRAVYCVQFAEVVYVLHTFQKKSPRGVKTSDRDLRLIRSRLAQCREEYAEWLKLKT